MTENKLSRSHVSAQATGVMLAFLLIMSCFLGYQIGADVADRENAADAAAQPAPAAP